MGGINKYAKAIAAAVGSSYFALQTAMADNIVTGNEWILVVAAGLVTGTAVYATTNAPLDPPLPPKE